MGSITEYLTSRQLISPPSFLKNNIHFETIMGSNAYGVSSDSSDNDIYGFCIPPKHILFPHISGYITGFGKKPEKFEQYQQHSIIDDNKTNLTNYLKTNNIDDTISLKDIEEEIKKRGL